MPPKKANTDKKKKAKTDAPKKKAKSEAPKKKKTTMPEIVKPGYMIMIPFLKCKDGLKILIVKELYNKWGVPTAQYEGGDLKKSLVANFNRVTGFNITEKQVLGIETKVDENKTVVYFCIDECYEKLTGATEYLADARNISLDALLTIKKNILNGQYNSNDVFRTIFIEMLNNNESNIVKYNKEFAKL